jgi:hypothetical protein
MDKINPLASSQVVYCFAVNITIKSIERKKRKTQLIDIVGYNISKGLPFFEVLIFFLRVNMLVYHNYFLYMLIKCCLTLHSIYI